MALTGIGQSLAQSKSAGTTLVNSTAGGPAPSVGVGDLIVVVFGSDDASGTYSCADSTGSNNYQIDVARVINSAHCSLVVFSAVCVALLGNGTSITVTHPSLTARAMSVWVITGGVDTTASRVDVTPVTATGTGNAGSGGMTTVSASAVMIGASVYESDNTNTYTQDANFSPAVPSNPSSSGTTGGGDVSNINVVSGHKDLTSTDTDAYDTTNSASRNWAAALVAYKAAVVAQAQVPYLNPMPALLAQ